MSYIVYVQAEFVHPSGDRFVDPRRSEACVEWSPGVIRVVPIGARWLPPPGINRNWKVEVSVWSPDGRLLYKPAPVVIDLKSAERQMKRRWGRRSCVIAINHIDYHMEHWS